MSRRKDDDLEARLGNRSAPRPADAGPLFAPQAPAELEAGRKLRDEGAQRAEDHAGDAWRGRARAVLLRVAQRLPEFAADDVRQAAQDLGMEEPPNPNAWGGIFLWAIRQGAIERTGAYRQSGRKEQHATVLPVYRRVGGKPLDVPPP